jgi:uncharacterized protein (TIGR02246 family)
MRSITAVVAAMLVVGLILGADGPRPATQATAQDGDEKEIRALLGQLGEEWNRHDMKAFSARLAEDANVVNRFGQWMKGRVEIEKHLVELHAMPFRDSLSSRSSKVEQVQFLTPDVAVAHERTDEGKGQSVRTYVLQKQGGKWLIRSADIIQVGTLPGH